MNIIDTHTHLYSEQFEQDVDQVIKRALKVGVNQFYLPSIDQSYTKRMYALEEKYPKNIKLMMGLHPCSVHPDTIKEEMQHVKDCLQDRTFKAIGEIGIDLYWSKEYLELQKHVFKEQIKLAKRQKLPIVIHCREAFNEVFDILEEEKGEDLFGIFHCFSGTKNDAERVVSYNLKIGIGGVVTFKNGKIDQFLKEIDLKNIVLETDAPYLSPIPYRGKRNESSYLINILNKLADIYRLDPQSIAEITTKNALGIFER